MTRKRGANGPEQEQVIVSIYCTGYDQDIEYETNPGEADRIVNSFLHDKFIKIVDGEETTYINTLNVVRITVE